MFEYKTRVFYDNHMHSSNDDFIRQMNELGSEGWELIQVIVTDYRSPIAIFKRKL